MQRARRFPIGEIDMRLEVGEGQIRNLKIYGDFFGKEPVDDLAQKLLGVRYHREDITGALAGVDIQDYFGALPKNDFIELLYGSDSE